MALECICDICGRNLGTCPEKYCRVYVTEYERICYRKLNVDITTNGCTYHDISHINMYICNDCMNKLKKEIEK
jgi:hypothetical protein